MTTRMTDERLAEITEALSSDEPGYDWIDDMHWLLALATRQREALRAVPETHRNDCPILQMADTPSNVETHCTCHVAIMRRALEEEP